MRRERRSLRWAGMPRACSARTRHEPRAADAAAGRSRGTSASYSGRYDLTRPRRSLGNSGTGRTVDLDPARRRDPLFAGRLDPDIRFVFNLTAATARGVTSSDGWYFVVPAAPDGARFGLDEANTGFGASPSDWSNVAWPHADSTRGPRSRRARLPRCEQEFAARRRDTCRRRLVDALPPVGIQRRAHGPHHPAASGMSRFTAAISSIRGHRMSAPSAQSSGASAGPPRDALLRRRTADPRLPRHDTPRHARARVDPRRSEVGTVVEHIGVPAPTPAANRRHGAS